MFMDCKVLDFEQRFDQILSEFEEYKEISESVEVMSDHKLYAFYMSKIKRLESIAIKIKKYNELKQDIASLDELLKDSDDLSVRSEKEFMVAEKEKIFEEIQKDLAKQKEKQEEIVIIEICSKEDFEFVEIIKNLIEDYAKQQQITVIEAAKEIFKNNTVFDETCSGKTNIIKNPLNNIIITLVDKNGMPMKGHGGNIIENTSFNLNSKSDNYS